MNRTHYTTYTLKLSVQPPHTRLPHKPPPQHNMAARHLCGFESQCVRACVRYANGPVNGARMISYIQISYQTPHLCAATAPLHNVSIQAHRECVTFARSAVSVPYIIPGINYQNILMYAMRSRRSRACRNSEHYVSVTDFRVVVDTDLNNYAYARHDIE